MDRVSEKKFFIDSCIDWINAHEDWKMSSNGDGTYFIENVADGARRGLFTIFIDDTDDSIEVRWLDLRIDMNRDKNLIADKDGVVICSLDSLDFVRLKSSIDNLGMSCARA